MDDMPALQHHITASTPMGANLVGGGAAFRLWAPRAREVYICGDFNHWTRDAASLLVQHADGRWAGFIPHARDGERYKFYVVGAGSEGFKRDPYARDLTNSWPDPDCILRSSDAFPWQDHGWRTPDFRDLVIYQLHIGTWFGPNRERRVATFLDVVDRIEYLRDLGVNAIEPLPIVEYSTPRSMGYNGSDLFSPEMDYEVADQELDRYVDLANRLLRQKGKAPLERRVLAVGINQLKAMVDICHHYGIAVIFDVVYRDRGLRIPSLAAAGGSTRTWHATSRSRVATGLILTAPGIPMLFMGQEIYEDKRWADDVPNHLGTLVDWDGLQSDKAMIDFHRFTRELTWLRRRHPALRAEGVRTLSMENGPRVLVFQRWIEGVGRDVVVVASLNESTLAGYQIPMPAPGTWLEVFNSDVYENWVNPATAGNGGVVQARGPALNGLPYSAWITVPANSLLVFARDAGD